MTVLLSRSAHDTASAIRGNLKAIKDIVEIVKDTISNGALSQEYALLWEMETKLGTTVDMVEKFIKPAHLLYDNDNKRIMEKLSVLHIEGNVDKVIPYPELDVILRCSPPTCHVQTHL